MKTPLAVSCPQNLCFQKTCLGPLGVKLMDTFQISEPLIALEL